MSQSQLVIIVVAIIAAAAVVIYFLKLQSTKRLRERFGPEYTRAVETSGNTLRGEAQLKKLEKRVERYDIHPLAPEKRERFVEAWRRLQAKFVDEPDHALSEADQLVAEAMIARGYPVADFEQQAADLSVNHPLVIENYRAGHAIALKHGQGKASTEDLRQALIHYRELFDELVGEPAVNAQARAAGR
jgi:predicted nucleic acid-binding protein